MCRKMRLAMASAGWPERRDTGAVRGGDRVDEERRVVGADEQLAADQRNAAKPVSSCPRTRVCISLVPS